ncbi:MAG: AsnC family transcriptional regulator, partial [Candidatus Woesearchaeota archaeon]
MNPHLDKFDENILYEMNKNGRISISEIANKLKKSKNFVSKRLRKMRQNRTLLHSAMLVDRSKLGLQTYYLYLRLVD